MAHERHYYVSPVNGNDRDPEGDADNPLASLEEAYRRLITTSYWARGEDRTITIMNDGGALTTEGFNCGYGRHGAGALIIEGELETIAAGLTQSGAMVPVAEGNRNRTCRQTLNFTGANLVANAHIHNAFAVLDATPETVFSDEGNHLPVVDNGVNSLEITCARPDLWPNDFGDGVAFSLVRTPVVWRPTIGSEETFSRQGQALILPGGMPTVVRNIHFDLSADAFGTGHQILVNSAGCSSIRHTCSLHTFKLSSPVFGGVASGAGIQVSGGICLGGVRHCHAMRDSSVYNMRIVLATNWSGHWNANQGVIWAGIDVEGSTNNATKVYITMNGIHGGFWFGDMDRATLELFAGHLELSVGWFRGPPENNAGIKTERNMFVYMHRASEITGPDTASALTTHGYELRGGCMVVRHDGAPTLTGTVDDLYLNGSTLGAWTDASVFKGF